MVKCIKKKVKKKNKTLLFNFCIPAWDKEPAPNKKYQMDWELVNY